MSTPVGRVSGPGRFSQRTDQPKVDIPNADYGEQKDYQALQSGAPMAASPGVSTPNDMPTLQSLLGNAATNVIPLGANTQRPNEPVTTPAPVGMPKQQQDTQDLSSQLPVIEFMANQPNASWGLRNLVRQIKGSM